MRMPPGTGMVPGTARPGSRAGEMGGGTSCKSLFLSEPCHPHVNAQVNICKILLC